MADVIDLSENSPEALAWQAGRSATAAAFLDGLVEREEWQRRIAARMTDNRQAPVVGRGGRWFQNAVLSPDDEQPVVVVRESLSGEPRVLVDPNALSAERGAPVSVQMMQPSPDGRWLACVASQAGTEVFELLLVDVDSGQVVPEGLPWSVTNLTWLPDSSGFFCSARAVVDGEFRCPVYRHILGAPPEEPLFMPPNVTDINAIVSADGKHAVLRSGNTESRLDWVITGDDMRPFLRDLPGGFIGSWDGDDLVVITDGGAPRGRLVRIPLATAADTSTWTELVAESEDVLRSVAVIGDTIVLGYLRDAAARVRLLDLEGQLLEEIAFDVDGTIGSHPFGASHPALPMFVVGDDEISFIRSSFDCAWGVYRYVISQRRLEVVTPPAITVDGLVVRTITATSSDGVVVPAHVVHRADVDMSVPRPTLLYGYGGFNLAYLPAFASSWTAWVESGGVFVLSHLRGGSEFGSQWWAQGRRATKQRTFDDLYAVAEELLATGVTTTAQLAVRGESNGGLLTGVATVQRPELWAAVASDVPIFDLIGFARDPLSFVIGKDEYGDPHIPAEAEWLRAISPVHNVKPADFPAVLVTAGENDPRCPVWQSRVFVDLLERANTGDKPILLRVYADQGHGASGLSALSAKDADWLAFVAAATGLEIA